MMTAGCSTLSVLVLALLREGNSAGKLLGCKKVCALLLLCAATAMASASQFPILTFDGTSGASPEYVPLVPGTDGNFYGITGSGGVGSSEFCSGCGTIFKITPAGALTTLYSFCSQPKCIDGGAPSGLIQSTDGNFYGATADGGTNLAGTVFKITPEGALTTLYSFCPNPAACLDGSGPNGLVQAADGNFYGTTSSGGVHSAGTVFETTPAGALRTLHSFDYADGAYAWGELIQATNGGFYGATLLGGAVNKGTIYKITPAGALTTLYSFCSQIGCTDGIGPNGLVQGLDGNFYGTTGSGGVNGYNGSGTFFKITPEGALTTLYSFCTQTNCADGGEPSELVQATDGNFYGTNFTGGTYDYGTIFKITPKGALTTLHTFVGFIHGLNPSAGLVQGTTGIFYGTTLNGGEFACSGKYGCGTIFSLNVKLKPFVETRPTSGKVAANVTILGTNLTGATSVALNGTAATFTVVSSTEIMTTVPTGATTGPVQVVTPSAMLTSNVPFHVIP
jgi:uncharacterized repeat protein (TIGR03803 family)